MFLHYLASLFTFSVASTAAFKSQKSVEYVTPRIIPLPLQGSRSFRDHCAHRKRSCNAIVCQALADVDGDLKHATKDTTSSTAIFGMGCFWAPQETFKGVPGVLDSTAGYNRIEPLLTASGEPSYFSVCQGDGSTEAVKITFDSSVVSFEELLRIFWQNHDASIEVPGKEIQYQSVIWPQSEKQRDYALSDVIRARDAYGSDGRSMPLTVVADVNASTFVPAETYHQDFWLKTRAKLAIFAVLLLIPYTGSQELLNVAAVGYPLLIGWWFVENLELMIAAFPSL